MKSIKIVTHSDQHWLEERVKDLTSTEMSALFGLSPYSTYFETWHNKKNQTYITLEENERMSWGKALESAIASEAGRVNKWDDITPRKDYYRIEELRLGSSFDYEAIINDKPTLLEVKNVDGFVFKEKWKEDEEGNIEAPYHIELQMQHQLLVSQYEQGVILALVGGNRLVTLLRTPNYEIQQKIIETAKEFWSSIEENKVPQADYVKDADFIISMYQAVTEKKVLEDNSYGQMVLDFKQQIQIENDAGDIKKSIRAKIVEQVDDVEKIKGVVDGRNFSISMGLRKDGNRNFLVYVAKEK